MLDRFADMSGSFNQFGDNRFAVAWKKYMRALSADPELLSRLVNEHTARQGELLADMAKGKGKAGDRPAERPDPRFAHEAWDNNPFYRLLRENYQLNSKLLRDAAASVEMESEDRQAIDFMLGQVISALAPSNFPTTNPEVIDATIESKGENLRRGMKNYMNDVQAGAITQSAPDAFIVGSNVAATPGKVIAQNHLMQLIEYAPATPKVNARPLLIVPPCINKYYILDLSPDNSLVRHLVASGQRVFLISWVNADAQHATLGWDDYVAGGVLEALAIVHEVCGGKQEVHTLGYCIGGTLLACALSVMRSNGDDYAASFSLLASFLDFCDTGTVGLFVDEKFVAEQEEKFAPGGLFDGNNLRSTFAYMRPDELVWPYVVRNYMLGETPPPFDILHWNADATNLPGRMYAWYLRHTYLDNDLKDGQVKVCGSKVKYGSIGLPGMAIAAKRDHIVPWQAAYASAQELGKDIDFVLASAGHVAGIVNPPARNKGSHWVVSKAGSLPADATQWLAKAKQHDGSWWEHYVAWLDKRSGGKVAAPKKFGSYRHLPLDDAPGSYVTTPLPPINGVAS